MADDNNNSTVNSVADDQQKQKEKKKGKGSGINIKAAQNIIKFISTHIVVIGYVALALLIIIFVIGILQILITMPGLILGKIKEFVTNFVGKFISQFNGDSVSYTVYEEDEIELATYIRDMGYDIEGFGFGEFSYKEEEDENGDVQKEIDKVHDGDEKKGVRGYLRKYLVSTSATYAPAIWSLGGEFTTLFTAESAQDKSTGMIRIKKDGVDIDTASPIMDLILGKENFKILPEEKAIKVRAGNTYYYFNMSDWTSKYGKPMELFLALHLSTMMPDLTYDLATADAFNTKVTIDFQTVKQTYEVNYTTQDGTTYDDQEQILRDYVRLLTGSSTTATGEELFKLIDEVKKDKDKKNIKPDDWILADTVFRDFDDSDRNQTKKKVEAMIDLIKNGQKETTMYWPRITDVKKHWFYNTIDFNPVYGRAKYAEKDIIYAPEDSSNGLYGVDGIILNTTMTSEIGFYYQLAEPERDGPNDAIIALFKGGSGAIEGSNYDFSGKYYRYDGTKDRAKKINNARAVDNGGGKYLFQGKTYNVEPVTVFKEPVVFYDVNDQNSNKNAYTAFAMLEKSHSEEAEVSYRCLKELLIKLEYFTEEELQDPVTQVLKWIVPDMTTRQRRTNVGKDPNLYGLKISGVSSPIIAPGDGKVIDVDGNTITVEFGKLNSQVTSTLKTKYNIKDSAEAANDDEIQLYYIDENAVVGLQMVIVGINPSVSVGQTVYVDQYLGTSSDGNVQVYFKREDGSIVDNIETYIDVYDENFEVDDSNEE